MRNGSPSGHRRRGFRMLNRGRVKVPAIRCLLLADSRQPVRLAVQTGLPPCGRWCPGSRAPYLSRPSPQACFAMLLATIQAKAAAHHANAPFDASANPQSPPKPGEPLLGHPCRWRLPRIEDDDMFDPGLLRRGFVGRRIDPTVGGQQSRGRPKRCWCTTRLAGK